MYPQSFLARLRSLKYPTLACVYLGTPHPGTAPRRPCSHPCRYMSVAQGPPWYSWHRASSPHGQRHRDPSLGIEVVRNRQGIKEKARERMGQPPQAFQSGVQGIRVANLSNGCRCPNTPQHRHRQRFQWSPVCSWEGWQPFSLCLPCPAQRHPTRGWAHSLGIGITLLGTLKISDF